MTGPELAEQFMRLRLKNERMSNVEASNQALYWLQQYAGIPFKVLSDIISAILSVEGPAPSLAEIHKRCVDHMRRLQFGASDPAGAYETLSAEQKARRWEQRQIFVEGVAQIMQPEKVGQKPPRAFSDVWIERMLSIYQTMGLTNGADKFATNWRTECAMRCPKQRQLREAQ